MRLLLKNNMLEDILNNKPNDILLKNMIDCIGVNVIVDKNCELYFIYELLYALYSYYEEYTNHISLFFSDIQCNNDTIDLVRKLDLENSVYYYADRNDSILSVFMGADCFLTNKKRDDNSVFCLLAEKMRLAIIRVDNSKKMHFSDNTLVVNESNDELVFSLYLLADKYNRRTIWE